MEVESLDGTLWHAYRRWWANAEIEEGRLVDRRAAGGWNADETFNRIYRKPRPAGMLDVIQQIEDLVDERESAGRNV